MKLFLPQGTLEEWALAEKADVREDRLALAGETGSYPVRPALHVATLVSGPDEHELLGRVKTVEQLQALGAEQLSDSVISGESAYDVVSGYLVELPDLPAPVPVDREGAEDLLARYLLDKM